MTFATRKIKHTHLSPFATCDQLVSNDSFLEWSRKINREEKKNWNKLRVKIWTDFELLTDSHRTYSMLASVIHTNSTPKRFLQYVFLYFLLLLLDGTKRLHSHFMKYHTIISLEHENAPDSLTQSSKTSLLDLIE